MGKEDLKEYPFVIVGCGFFGAVVAEHIATQLKKPVVIIDKRNHIGGNSYSEVDEESGVEYHKYGSHIFHTRDLDTWNYVRQFSEFNHYRHRVLTSYKDRLYQMPINLFTINSFYEKNFSPQEAFEFIQSERVKIDEPKNLEEKAISLIGQPLYDAFIKGYTIKQWEKDPKELPESIINRLPVRYRYDDAYFDDPYQGIPVEGYGAIFRKMLRNDLIEVRLNTDFFEMKSQISSNSLVIYTGPIDQYFDYRIGVLGWRTLNFDKKIENVDDFQGTSVVNYAEAKVPYTRIHEFKHYHPERPHPTPKTLLYYEYSKTAGKGQDPYYPINTSADRKLYGEYTELAKQEKNVIFGGRLGTYKYYDMHQVIASARTTFKNKIVPWAEKEGVYRAGS